MCRPLGEGSKGTLGALCESLDKRNLWLLSAPGVCSSFPGKQEKGEMAFSWVCVVSGSCQVSLDLAILLATVASVM